MASDVLEFFRSKDARFRDVPDDELTSYVARRWPQFLQDEPFRKRVALTEEKAAVQADSNEGQRSVLNAAEGLVRGVTAIPRALVGSVEGQQDLANSIPGQAIQGAGRVLSGAGDLLAEDVRKGTDAIGMAPDRLPAQVAQESVRMLPVVGASAALAAAGVPAPVAMAAPMAAQAYQQTGGDLVAAERAGAIGAVLGPLQEFGAAQGAQLAGRAAALTGNEAAQNAALALGRVTGSQAMVNGILVAEQAPELLAMAKEDPKRAKEELVKLVAANLAFEVPHLPGLVRESLARDHVASYLEGPEYRQAVDAMARRSMDEGQRETLADNPRYTREVPLGRVGPEPAEELASSSATEVFGPMPRSEEGIPEAVHPEVAAYQGLEAPTLRPNRTVGLEDSGLPQGAPGAPSPITQADEKRPAAPSAVDIQNDAAAKEPWQIANEKLDADDAAGAVAAFKGLRLPALKEQLQKLGFDSVHNAKSAPDLLRRFEAVAPSGTRTQREATAKARRIKSLIRKLDEDEARLKRHDDVVAAGGPDYAGLSPGETRQDVTFAIQRNREELSNLEHPSAPTDSAPLTAVRTDSVEVPVEPAAVAVTTPAMAPAADPPTKAAKKIKREAEKVADAKEGPKSESMAEIKRRIVASLSEAWKTAPSESDLIDVLPVTDWANRRALWHAEDIRRSKTITDRNATSVIGRVRDSQKAALAKAMAAVDAKKITVEIPGDGTFTIWNTKENIAHLLERYGGRKAAEAVTGGNGAGEVGAGAGDSLASAQRATLPRQVQSVPGYATPDGRPVSLGDVRRYLAKSLDIPVRMRGYGQRAYGIFRPRPETIRLAAINDVPTLAHEVGHYLHQLLFGFSDWQRRYDAELMPLGQVTSRASYTPQQVRREGVAEHLRIYLTDRAAALAAAPQFTAFMEAELQRRFPETWQVLGRARADLARFINQTPHARVRSMISRDPEVYRGSVGQRLSKTLNRAYTAWVNSLHPMARSLAQLQRFGLPRNVARQATDLAVNYIGGWRGKVEHTLHHRQTDLVGNDVGPGLREVLRGVESLEDLGDYLVAKRVLEKSGQGLRTGIDPMDAQQVVTRFDGQYGQVRQALRTFQRNNLQLLVDAGILDPGRMAAMEQANADYVPFYRVMEQPGVQASAGPRGGKGFINGAQGIGRFKGSDREIIDPLESIIKNTYLFRDLAERNRVGVAFVDAVNQTQGGGRVADSVIRKQEGVRVPHEHVIEALEAQGVDTQALGLNQLNLAFTLWRAARSQRDPANGIFTTWRGGQEERWQTDDAELYKAMTLSDGTDARMASNFLAAGLRGVASTLRAGAVLVPEFIARNPIRDQFTAAVFARGGFIPFWDGARGLFHATRQTDLYRDWQRAGGANSHMTALDRPNLREALAEVVADPTALRQALEWADPRNVIRNLARVSQVMEEATRVTAFDRARRAGMSDAQAANASKEATLNFARGGETGRWVNRYTAFFNASVQDLDLFARMHDPRDPRQLARIAAKGFMYITAPSLAAWYLGKDDERIQELPKWRKNFFWNLNVGKAMGQGDWIVSLPKPFLLGQVYGSSVENALDWMHGRNPKALQEWFGATLSTLPLAPETFIPTAGKPALEWWANKSFFRGQPLESAGMENLPPNLRFTPNSSLWSRELADMLPANYGVSPVKVDNTVRGIFGGLGKYGSDALDWAIVKAGVADVPPAPTKTLAEMPLIKAFANSPYQASAYVERFYQAATDAEQLVNAARKAPQLMESQAQQSWYRDNRPRLEHYLAGGDQTVISQVRKVKSQLSDIHQAMTAVQTSRTMTPDAKRDRLIELSRMRDTLAKNAFNGLMAPSDRERFR